MPLIDLTRGLDGRHLLEEISDSLLARLVDMDYVLLMVDMTNPASEALLNQALTFLSPGHILSKCAIVFTKGKENAVSILRSNPFSYIVDMADIWMVNEMGVRNMIQRFGNPMIFYANLKVESKECQEGAFV